MHPTPKNNLLQNFGPLPSFEDLRATVLQLITNLVLYSEQYV